MSAVDTRMARPEAVAEGVAERFWAKVIKSDGCWLFGDGDPDTYGKFWDGSRPVDAHTFAYALAFGSIPDGKWVLHTCDVKRCVRNDGADSHLYAGTPANNTRDALERGRLPTGERHYLVAHPEKARSGERAGNAKLTQDQVGEIRRRYAAGESQSVLGKLFGIERSTVGRIVRGETWR